MARRIQLKREMTEADAVAVGELVDQVTTAQGRRPLNEYRWLELLDGGGPGFVGLVLNRGDGRGLLGYAQLAHEGDWHLELVVDPAAPDWSDRAGELLNEARRVVGREGGGRLRLWAQGAGERHEKVAGAAGMVCAREILRLRRPLPAAAPPPEFEARPFRPGLDDQDFLALNNRAFLGHPDQGNWERATLRERQSQTWFDPAGLILHERDGRLAGFCWTKVEVDREPPEGELYVLGVDPDLSGLGIGGNLALSGLDLLHRRGLTTAILYVDAGNTGARRLYERLGFALDSVDRAYEGEIEATPGLPD